MGINTTLRSTQAIPLMQGICTRVLLADKGYDANALLDWLTAHDMAEVIPHKANRKIQRDCDWYLYKERHVVEYIFDSFKYYSRIASRFGEKASHFKEMLASAVVMV